MFSKFSTKGLTALDRFCLPRKSDLALKIEDVHGAKSSISNSDTTLPDVTSDNINFGHGALAYSSLRDSVLSSQPDSSFIPRIILDILNGNFLPGRRDFKSDPPDLSVILEAGRRNLLLQIEYNKVSLSAGIRKKLFPDHVDPVAGWRANQMPKEVKWLINAHHFFSERVEHLPIGQVQPRVVGKDRKHKELSDIVRNKRNIFQSTDLNLTLAWDSTILYVSYDNHSYTLPLLCLQELTTKIADHISVLFFCRMASGTYLEDEAYDTTVSFIKFLHRTHKSGPKSFWAVAGSLEALAIAVLIQRHED
jgi:hypothetical protein